MWTGPGDCAWGLGLKTGSENGYGGWTLGLDMSTRHWGWIRGLDMGTGYEDLETGSGVWI